MKKAVVLCLIGISVTLVLVTGVMGQSNYISDRERDESYKVCERQVLTSVVGKKFIAKPESSLKPDPRLSSFWKFYNLPDTVSKGFVLRKPEEFTVVRLVKDLSWETYLKIYWYEIRFVSGKVGFVPVVDLCHLSDGPSIRDEINSKCGD